MNVLIVGGGGREHALTWGLARSARVDQLHAAPGNAGIAQLATCHQVAADDLDEIVDARRPPAPGPRRRRARSTSGRRPRRPGALERASRCSAPAPMPRARRFEGVGEGDHATGRDPDREGGDVHRRGVGGFVRRRARRPGRVKADGLAAGKGVTVAADREGAFEALHDCLEAGAFGAAGATVVVEEVLEGPEVSAFALVDATSIVPLGLSQDFKRVGDADTGPNTGGMGAFSPAAVRRSRDRAGHLGARSSRAPCARSASGASPTPACCTRD